MGPVRIITFGMVVATLVAGCGAGGSSPGVANIGSGTSTTASASSSAAAGGAAATGGGGGGGGAALNSSSPPGGGGGQSSFAIAGNGGANLLKFSQCMRANGEPNFPDPNGQGVIQGSGLNPQSAQFQAAQKKCAKDLGAGGAPSPAQQAQFQAKALAFSACMRAHGVPDFPDPQISGGHVQLKIHAGPGTGLDPSSPVFQKAQKDCQADLPGKAGGLPVTAPGAP